MASCFAHAGVAATGTCDKCQTPICMRCTKGTLEGFMCPPCAHKTYGRRKLVTALKITGLVGFCLAIGLLALVVIGKGSRNEKPKPLVLRDPDPEIAIMLDERDQAPCDRRLIRKLADRLGQLDRYKDVVDHTSAFFAKCGAFPRLEWSVVYALQQLGRYAEAVKHETVIIEDDPFDSDYWWWRGEDRARSNQPDLALADYRQSFANSESERGGRFAAVRVLDVAGPASKGCEGVWAIRYYERALGGSPGDDLRRRADGLAQAGQCEQQGGTGAALMAPDAADGTVRAAVTIGTATATLVVDPRAGTTVVSRDVATRAGLATTGPTVQTVAGNVLRSGTLVTTAVAVGEARAAAVEVMIVDGLPAGVDGYLGLSFLWTFGTIGVVGGVSVGP